MVVSLGTLERSEVVGGLLGEASDGEGLSGPCDTRRGLADALGGSIPVTGIDEAGGVSYVIGSGSACSVVIAWGCPVQQDCRLRRIRGRQVGDRCRNCLVDGEHTRDVGDGGLVRLLVSRLDSEVVGGLLGEAGDAEALHCACDAGCGLGGALGGSIPVTGIDETGGVSYVIGGGGAVQARSTVVSLGLEADRSVTAAGAVSSMVSILGTLEIGDSLAASSLVLMAKK